MIRTMLVVVVFGWILAFVLALTVLTLREARGAECRVEKTGCRWVPLANGREGERVLVCERVKVVCDASAHALAHAPSPAPNPAKAAE